MIESSGFQPAVLLRNRHLQTILPNLGLRILRRPPLSREQLELPDGDFLHLDWLVGGTDQSKPLLLCLHGLEGSSRSNYASDLLRVAGDAGWQAAVVHFRGCSGTLNRLNRSYHAGETADLAQVLEHVAQQRRFSRLFAVGYSLGGNVLLKHLGEAGPASPLDAAVAVSVPFDLDGAARSISGGVSRLYQYLLMQKMKRRVRQKAGALAAVIDVPAALRSTGFAEFDELVTAPLHGFAGCKDYYARCSSRQFLGVIRKPTLILQARDDPFLDSRYLPSEGELADSVQLELSMHGGHVGFVGQKKPWQPYLWLPRRIFEFLRTQT